MKNSPHHFKHLRKKALRSLSLTDVKTAKMAEKIAHHSGNLSYMSVSHNGFRSFKDHLRPINSQKAEKMLLYFIKHWEREKIVHLKTVHGSKRTTPGEVEGEGPYSKNPKNPKKMIQKLESGTLQKSQDAIRHIIKNQNQHHKKAA